MRNYSWKYGIFHWIIHFLLAIMLVKFSGISIVPNQPYRDYAIVIIFTSLIDLDHIQVLKKFGLKKYIWAEKRLPSPLHNFFFLSILGISSAFLAIFVSKTLSVLIFSVALHLIWDIIEDVFIFKTSFRRWEKTWGLNTKDIQELYNELLQIESQKKNK
jgi:hypothetical protein